MTREEYRRRAEEAIPRGPRNNVLGWMYWHMAWHDHPTSDPEGLAGAAARTLGHPEWLREPDHWVWAAAALTCDWCRANRPHA